MPPVLGPGGLEEVQAMRVECAAALVSSPDDHRCPASPAGTFDSDFSVAGQMVGLEAVQRSTS